MSRRLLLAALAVGLVACGRPALPDFTGLVEEAAPAIVNISGTAAAEEARPPEHPLYDWFREFLDPEQAPPGAEPGPRDSLGSGFIISADGEILTNHHVVAQAEEIIVTLADRRQFQARLIGRDPASDLALLKIDAEDLPALRFGSSAALKVGEWVLAIGSPFGFEQTVTAGVVSAKRRALGSEQYVPYLQTDVAINPGNSGGPLFNLDGEVIGINSQIYSQTGGYMGLSFAVPADTAQRVIDQLRQHGRVQRGWLGVVIQDVDRELAASFELERAAGALISHVEPGSPAAEAGLRPGDVVLSVDGDPVASSGALPPMIGQHAPGDRVKLGIVRNGKRLSVRVRLSELAVESAAAADWTGLRLAAVDSSRLQRAGVASALLVEAVAEGSPAAAAGLRRGDWLLNWAGETLPSVERFGTLAQGLAPGRTAPLLVRRGERSLFLVLERPAG